MAYTTLLFDLDDTILDFGASEHAALESSYEHHFSAACDKELFVNTYRRINRALWDLVEKGQKLPSAVKEERFKRLVETLSLSIDPSTAAEFYESCLGQQTIWLPGAKQGLEQLQKTYRIGIVTNGFRSVQEKKYYTSGLNAWCSCFITSEDVGIAKPDPRIFEVALRQLNSTSKDTLMIGDSLASDYKGAIGCGLDFCWVNPTGRPLEEEFPPPRYVVKSIDELAAVL